ncbi:MAG: hypothetical protein ABR589_12835, partial [Chthoniobacterales bacterium]
MIGTTIATRDNLPRARVLAQSFLHHHPGSRFTILVPDAFTLAEPAGKAVQVLSLEDIDLAPEDLHRLPKIYAGAELALAVKPFFISHLLTREAELILCFDYDIEVFGPLDDVVRQAGLGLPIWAARENDGGVATPESGFMVIGHSAEEFLATWSGTLRTQFDRSASLDPSLYEGFSQVASPRLLEGAGFNVGYWSLRGRHLEAAGDTYQIDGEPLRFFHFEGYDPKRPHLLSTREPYHPGVVLGGAAALRKIDDEYRAKLAVAEEGQRRRYPFGYGLLPSSTRIDRFMQRVYLRALRRSKRKEGPEPPDPFRAEGESSFFKWLNQRVFDG